MVVTGWAPGGPICHYNQSQPGAVPGSLPRTLYWGNGA